MLLKKPILLLCALLLNITLFAQYQISIDVTILEKGTNKPIPYVNVGFKDKNIKTVSDKEGKFTLTYDENSIGKNDILEFTSLGYKTFKIRGVRLFKHFKYSNIIYLTPKTFFNNTTISQKGNVFGKITSKKDSLQGVTIKIKNTFTEVQTDANGNYRILAKKNDVLVISYIGMKEKRIKVSTTNNINIELEPDGEELEEIALVTKAKKKNEVDLGLGGKKNVDGIGTSYNVMTPKDIGDQYLDLTSLLRGKFAGVHVGIDGSIWLRGGKQSILSPAQAIFNIDGVIYDTNAGQTVPYIDPKDIETLTILKSLAATNKYGTIGSGGVIVVKTKLSNAAKIKRAKKNALIKGNDYSENILSIDQNIKEPNYITELQNTSTYKKALEIYEKQKEVYQLDIPYYLEVSNYFMRWNKEYGYSILSNITRVAYNNAKALSVLAYRYEELNKLEEAKQTYQRILTLQPTSAQPYLNLARIYKETGNYKLSMKLYKQMYTNTIKGVDFSGSLKIIESELKHLVTVYRTKVKFDDLPANLLKANFKYDIRIVFEWSDSSSEFEVQFVNPRKKYFTWEHSKFQNKKKILDEIKNGYRIEEFIIDDANSGEWIINMISLNEKKSLNPTYLKYTVYKNYGTKKETKVIKIVKLLELKEKITLDKFNY